MNRFENSFEQNQATKENKQQHIASRRIVFSKDYQEHINDSLDTLTEIAESPLYTPDKDRVVYMGAAEPQTNAAYNLDITHSQNEHDTLALDSLQITAFGGVAADPAVYNYTAKSGEFTKKISESKQPQPVSVDEIITRLADDYPNNEQLQSLLDTPTATIDTEFIVYILENSLVDYAEQAGAEKAMQARYKNLTTSIEETDKGIFPVDRSNELIITTTGQGNHYQLDVDSPYDFNDPDTRKSINYQVSNPESSKGWGTPACTAAVRSSRQVSAVEAQKASTTTQNDAYFEILRAIDSFSSEMPTQELL